MSSLPDEEKEWRLTTNAQYLDVMKVLMNLTTASLVLPIFFVRNFVAPKNDCKPLAQSLNYLAYIAWASLILSLVCGMSFYRASAKYVKVVSGGKEKSVLARLLCNKEVFCSVSWFEHWRDYSAVGTVILFIAGVVFSLLFFKGLP